MLEIHWLVSEFKNLTPLQLYKLIQLRTEVFVIEQDAVYQDLDDLDQPAIHVMGLQASQLVGYSRIIPPGLKYSEAAIGRIVVQAAARKQGLGKLLIEFSMGHCNSLFPDSAIKISAQAHLEKYYGQFGFSTISQPYMEDGIPHLAMLKSNHHS